jgi:DNA-binding LacI/PurR family transcriptional regulator
MIERQVAGVVLMTSEMDSSLIDELANRNVSVVFLDLGSAGPHMSNLVVDYASGIEDAIRHLVGLGHRSIAYIGGPSNLKSAVKRLEAFRASISRHLVDAPAPLIVEADFQLEGGRRAAGDILLSPELPTAVVVANDMMAMGAMKEFRSAGLRIPADISVVGFDDIAFAAMADPPLTTICLPRSELGRRAVAALMTTIERADLPGVEIHIATYLIERGSTAPARSIKLQGAAS